MGVNLKRWRAENELYRNPWPPGLIGMRSSAGPDSVLSDHTPRTSSDNVDDEFDGSTAHPTTLTVREAQKATKARFDSPLDPDKPATPKAKQISPTPPVGKVDSGND